jgi:Aminotransferase class I and II
MQATVELAVSVAGVVSTASANTRTAVHLTASLEVVLAKTLRAVSDVLKSHHLLSVHVVLLLLQGVEEGFLLSKEALKAAITPKTRMLIFCNPSNPTGAVHDRQRCEEVSSSDHCVTRHFNAIDMHFYSSTFAKLVVLSFSKSLLKLQQLLLIGMLCNGSVEWMCVKIASVVDVSHVSCCPAFATFYVLVLCVTQHHSWLMC